MDAKNTVPVTIWGVPVWKGGGRQKISHLGTPRNHKVFVPIWGLTNIRRRLLRVVGRKMCVGIVHENGTNEGRAWR